jgi:hypothetical protein
MGLVRDEVAGDPITGKRWIRKSLRKLRRALAEANLDTGLATIHRLLRKHQISARSNRKSLEPEQHPDRDQQFQHIQAQRERFERRGYPIVSIDTKKKELLGLFKNPGRVWCEKPQAVYAHDFPDMASAKAVPYGIYDTQKNRGYVCVGLSADTPDFAVSALVWWWRSFGSREYPQAPELLLLADGGGSNGYRLRRFKQQLQVRLADDYGLKVTTCHYPPGASKWNPVEHRLFSEISKTWAGTPLTSAEVMLSAIKSTRTTTGLRVRATLRTKKFAKGKKVSKAEMASLALQRHQVCPRWNYTIAPRESGQ